MHSSPVLCKAQQSRATGTPNIPMTIKNQTYSEYMHSLTFRVRCCCNSNETRALIANLPNSAQLQGTSTIPPSHIRVHGVVWECGEGHTYTQTCTTNIPFASATLTQNVINLAHSLPIPKISRKSTHYLASTSRITSQKIAHVNLWLR